MSAEAPEAPAVPEPTPVAVSAAPGGPETGERVHSLHSRTVHPGGSVSGDDKAPARAPAREYDPSGAQSQVHSGDSPRRDWPDRLKPVLSWVLEEFTPPEIYAEDRPSLKKVIGYAKRGGWTNEVGMWRVAGILHSVPATCVIGAAYYVAWAVEMAVSRKFTLPKVHNQDRPSLKKIISCAKRGGWASKIAHAVPVLVIAAAYYVAWMVERPARFYSTALVLILLNFERVSAEVTSWVTSLLP